MNLEWQLLLYPQGPSIGLDVAIPVVASQYRHEGFKYHPLPKVVCTKTFLVVSTAVDSALSCSYLPYRYSAQAKLAASEISALGQAAKQPKAACTTNQPH